MEEIVEQQDEHKLTHKEKRYERIRNRLFKEKDIKYEGPFSYRVLRIFAWICLALSQVALLNSIATTLFHYNQLGETASTIIGLFASLSTPFFIIASFGLILSGRRDVRDFMLIYGVAYFGMGLGFVVFYLRYINGLFVKLGLEQSIFQIFLESFLADKVQVNVFADLFAFALFHFFVNFTPKKIFKGKSLIIFRLFSIIPLAFVIASYVFKILGGLGKLDIPFYIYPFFTTKSPIVYFVFVVASLWIKNRERWFLKLGASRKDYQKFLNTNRNSLSLSIHLSLIIVVSFLFDFILGIVLFAIYRSNEEMSGIVNNIFENGQTLGLLLIIPFLFLYSYKRKHKDARIDIAIPICGIALMVVVYVEGIYQLILNILGVA